MSLNSEITRLGNAKDSLKTAITNKGVTVPDSAKLDTYDDYISQIIVVPENRFVCVERTGGSCYSIDGVTWLSMEEFPSEADFICSVTYGNGKFVCLTVASGTGGVCDYPCYSVDGVTWAKASPIYYSHSGGDFYYVTYGNGRFVAANSDYNGFYYSIDGINWVASSPPTASYLERITYGNGRFVCVGNQGKSYYSADGVTWTAMSGLDSYTHYIGVAYGNGRFVCQHCYSVNGTTWVYGYTTFETAQCITYGGGRFICGTTSAGVSYYMDVNSSSWTQMNGLSNNAYIQDITYGNGRFIGVGYCYDSGTGGMTHALYYSVNGTTWVATTMPLSSPTLVSVTHTEWRDEQ